MARPQTARLLRLLSLLQNRREWTGEELAERLEVTGRTVRRDIRELRDLGYPIEGTVGLAGGYRLTSGRDLPPLLLEDEEAIAIAAALRTAAGSGLAGVDEAATSALAKLEQLLPARLRHQIDAAAQATTAIAVPGAPVLDPATLGVVAAACRDREILAFGYRTRGGAPGRRRVEPRSLIAVTGLWYLVAFDLDRDGWRSYRLDRMTAPAPTRVRFTPRALPSASPADFLRQSLRGAPYRYRLTVTVPLPAAAVRARLPRIMPSRIEEIDERTSRLELGDDAGAPLLADLARLDADVVLEGDPETLDVLAAGARRLLHAAEQPA